MTSAEVSAETIFFSNLSFCLTLYPRLAEFASRGDEEPGAKVRASFVASDRTYGARRVWRDLLAEGVSCGLHRIERLMRLQALKARPRRRRLPPDLGERQVAAVAADVLDRTFAASAPNRKWIADWLYVAVVLVFSCGVWSAGRWCRDDGAARYRWPGDGNLATLRSRSQYTSEQFQS